MAEIISKQISEDGTKKYLLQYEDGIQIETVLMTHAYGNSLCVSSQAGCNMGCMFCASGLLRKVRDLTAKEMLDQFHTVSKDLSEESLITHVVVMGTGEPFDNYAEVLQFCNLVSDPKTMGETLAVAPRHITVSTSGIIPKILEFASTEKRFNLAVSLHAPTNDLRNRMMPVNRKYPVDELVKSALRYSKQTKRRVAFEYLLLDGINDSKKDALALADLLSFEGLDSSDYFYVNLIPYNPVREFGLRGSEKETALKFYDVLMKQGIKATLRKEHGQDIAAACGQLRLK